MHLNQITLLQPQQQRLEIRLNCDRQSDGRQIVYLASAVNVCSLTFQRLFTAENLCDFRPKT